MVNSFDEWLKKIFSDRGLECPDRRFLYEYWLTDQEFGELENFLSEKISHRIKVHSLFNLYQPHLAEIASTIKEFPALFVLYAAEWWRRRYDGSGFNWTPILNDLGTSNDYWNESQRSKCIEQGLKFWKVPLEQSGGMRYIGTIALQGGLPMRLLSEARGRIGQLLKRVLKETVKRNGDVQGIMEWIPQIDNYLPSTYQKPSIYHLLARVIETVLDLKEQVQLTDAPGAIEKLSKAIPDWRKKFPFSVQDREMQGLLEQLIQDALNIKRETRKSPFKVERIIEMDHSGNWHLRSSISFPPRIDARTLKTFFGIKDQEIDSYPRFFTLTLDIGEQSYPTKLRKLAEEDQYIFDRSVWNIDEAEQEHLLSLSTADGHIWKMRASMGEALDPEQPWVFDFCEDHKILLKQGGGSFHGQEVLVSLPSESKTNEKNIFSNSIQPYGVMKSRQIVKVQGDLWITHLGNDFHIRTGRVDLREEIFTWNGNRCWDWAVGASPVFWEMPELWREMSSGEKHLIPTDQIVWRTQGGEWQRGRSPRGPIEVRYPKTGEVLFRSRIVILPQNAGVRLFSTNGDFGTIRLENWGKTTFQPRTKDLKVFSRQDNESLDLEIENRTVGLPQWVEGDLWWQWNSCPVHLRIPFPSFGAKIFGPSGKALYPEDLLSINQLLGVRVVFLWGAAASIPKMGLSFKLQGKQNEEIFVPVNPLSDKTLIELNLFHYQEEIEELLAGDDTFDAYVEVIAHIDSKQFSLIKVAHYSLCLERTEDGFMLEGRHIASLLSEELAEISLLAIRLETPGEEPESLPSQTSEGVPTGVWTFDPKSREPGSWLIYPAREGDISIRPALWPIPGGIEDEDPLTMAIGMANPELREHAFSEALQPLSMDFQSPQWNKVEQIYDYLRHLPLSALDMWRCFSRSGEMMASLAFRQSSIEWKTFLSRFSRELPFLWELVSYPNWYQSISNLNKQCAEKYAAAKLVVFKSHTERKIQEISSSNPALAFLLHIAIGDVSGVPGQEKQFNNIGDMGIFNLLFEGVDCFYQKLLRRHSEDRWPENLSSQIDKFRSCSHFNDLLYKPEGYRDSVVNLPIVLAIQSVRGHLKEWTSGENIKYIRGYMRFDQDWFDDAFNWTVARCFVKGYMK